LVGGERRETSDGDDHARRISDGIGQPFASSPFGTASKVSSGHASHPIRTADTAGGVLRMTHRGAYRVRDGRA
jgi:hypothetical protein